MVDRCRPTIPVNRSSTARRAGVPGGEFPLWVAITGDRKAYVSSLRDREIVVLDLAGDTLSIARRIHVPGNPNRMILDREQRRLFVALDNSDFVAIIDTAREHARDADGRQRLRPGPHRPETCPESLCGSTLIFVIEDDAQDGPDHVDAQRTVAYVIGPR